MISKIRRSLRKKENKTAEDYAILDLIDSISMICECIIDDSKQHLSNEQALEEIWKILEVLNNGEEYYKNKVEQEGEHNENNNN